MYLLNAFSLNMITAPAVISIKLLTAVEAARLLNGNLVSAVGHASTAAVFAATLDLPVEVARKTVVLSPGESAVVGQYRGPRLEEGATSLPEGATIEWLLVVCVDVHTFCGVVGRWQEYV